MLIFRNIMDLKDQHISEFVLLYTIWNSALIELPLWGPSWKPLGNQ
jgi:hypothetical protein